MKDLSEKELTIVGECLVAAVRGPFFPEWEFSALFGLKREDVAKVLSTWPNVGTDDETVSLAVNNSIGNLVGYPHGEDLSQFVSATPEHLLEILEKWRL